MFEAIEENFIYNLEDEGKVAELSSKIEELLDGEYYDVAMMSLLKAGRELTRKSVVKTKKQ